MPIYDQSFRRYEGERRTRMLWWPVARQTLRGIVRSKLMWLILLGLLVAVVAVSIGFFAASKLEQMAPEKVEEASQAIRTQNIPMFGRDVNLGTIFFSFLVPMFPVMWVLMLVAGGGSISSDLRSSALPLYFSRPLKPWEYALGKVLGLALVPAAAFAVAILLMYLQYVAYFRPPTALFTEAPVLLAAFLHIGLVSLFLALAMACFSSLTKTARTAAVMYLGFFVLMNALAASMREGTDMRELRALAPGTALQVIGRNLMNPNIQQFRMRMDVSGLGLQIALLSVLLYLVVFAIILRRNLRVVEVVK